MEVCKMQRADRVNAVFFPGIKSKRVSSSSFVWRAQPKVVGQLVLFDLPFERMDAKKTFADHRENVQTLYRQHL